MAAAAAIPGCHVVACDLPFWEEQRNSNVFFTHGEYNESATDTVCAPPSAAHRAAGGRLDKLAPCARLLVA